jgi:tetratricopeptide (TPR) repeat protein
MRIFQVVTFLFSIAASISSAGAGYVEDCSRGTGDIQIRGCTDYIDSGKYQGRPLAIAYSFRGIAYESNGQYDRAIADFDKAIGLDPNYAFAYSFRGDAYLKTGQHDRAIADYDRAIELGVEHEETYYNRGSAYQTKGQYDRAIADFDKAIALNPRYAAPAEALKRLGMPIHP